MNSWGRGAMGVVLLVLVLLVSACGPGVGAPTPVPTAAGGDALIVLKTTGSIAGVDTELRISGSGFATFYDKGEQKATRQMTPTSFAQINEFLQEADFFNLQERYDRGNVSDDTRSEERRVGKEWRTR